MLAPDGTRRRRALRLVAQGVVVVGIVGTTGAFATLHKSVTLDVDGTLHDVSAYGRTVAEVLDYQDVAVAPEDLVEPGLAEAAPDGGTILVRTSRELHHGARTDVGLVREVNEDALLASPPVFVVADGMGGHEGGDVASRIVVEEFARLVGDDYDPRRGGEVPSTKGTLG